jgi:hypothetical protein
MFFVRCGKYGILMAYQHHVGIKNAQDIILISNNVNLIAIKRWKSSSQILLQKKYSHPVIKNCQKRQEYFLFC